MELIIFGIIGFLYTNNKIDLSKFSKLYSISNVEGNLQAPYNYIYGGQVQKMEDRKSTPPQDCFDIYIEPINGKNVICTKLPENWEGYIGISSCHSAGNTWYFDYQTDYVRNYTSTDRYIDVYELFATKEDDWRSWVKLAGIDILNTQILEEILENGEILEKIFDNDNSNDYLLKCTGTLMVEILKNDSSYNKIPYELREKMKNNTDWNKFATIFNREL